MGGRIKTRGIETRINITCIIRRRRPQRSFPSKKEEGSKRQFLLLSGCMFCTVFRCIDECVEMGFLFSLEHALLNISLRILSQGEGDRLFPWTWNGFTRLPGIFLLHFSSRWLLSAIQFASSFLFHRNSFTWKESAAAAWRRNKVA